MNPTPTYGTLPWRLFILFLNLVTLARPAASFVKSKRMVRLRTPPSFSFATSNNNNISSGDEKHTSTNEGQSRGIKIAAATAAMIVLSFGWNSHIMTRRVVPSWAGRVETKSKLSPYTMGAGRDRVKEIRVSQKEDDASRQTNLGSTPGATPGTTPGTPRTNSPAPAPTTKPTESPTTRPTVQSTDVLQAREDSKEESCLRPRPFVPSNPNVNVPFLIWVSPRWVLHRWQNSFDALDTTPPTIITDAALVEMS